MKDTLTTSWEESEQAHRELQQRILEIPGSRRVLRGLSKQGANQEKLLSLLASSVTDVDFWRKPVRCKKRELESIADQLETVARHAHRISLDSLCYGTLWLAMLGIGKWEEVKPAKERAPIWIFDWM